MPSGGDQGTQMALMMGALYGALHRAGASEEDARKAAEEVAGYENRLAAIEVKLEPLDGKVTLLAWMVGFVIASQIAIFGVLVRLVSA